MNAEEAYKLAESKNNVDEFLTLIKNAAENGQTRVKTKYLLNPFQINKLQTLGYTVLLDNSAIAFTSSSKGDCHLIDWGLNRNNKNAFQALYEEIKRD